MNKKQIRIADHIITQLSPTEFELENKDQGLDFYIETGNPSAVEVFVFDSYVPTKGEKDPCVSTFYSANLEEAVVKAMMLTRNVIEENGRYYNAVQRLRDVANWLAADSNGNTKTILFPGWHEGFEEARESLIKEAATAILAEGIEPDEGTKVSQKAVAALIHYVADMME